MVKRIASLIGVLALTGVMFSGGLSPAAAAAQAQSATGSFAGQLQLKAEGADPDHPLPQIGFSGAVAWSEPKLRLEFTQELTLEPAILLLDFEQDEAVMLYPDTLNGFKAKLSELPGKDYLGHIRALLTSQGATAPAGWKIVVKEQSSLNGVAATHRKLEGPKGATAEYWVDGEGRPLQAKVATAKVELSATFSDVKYGVKVPADRFSYDPQAYHVSKYDPKRDEPAIPL